MTHNSLIEPILCGVFFGVLRQRNTFTDVKRCQNFSSFLYWLKEARMMWRQLVGQEYEFVSLKGKPGDSSLLV